MALARRGVRRGDVRQVSRVPDGGQDVKGTGHGPWPLGEALGCSAGRCRVVPAVSGPRALNGSLTAGPCHIGILRLRKWMAAVNAPGTGSTRAGDGTLDVRVQPIPRGQRPCPPLACPTGTQALQQVGQRSADR
jgi:hypothetical protein